MSTLRPSLCCRVVDAVLDVIPTAEPRMDEIAAKIRPILQVSLPFLLAS